MDGTDKEKKVIDLMLYRIEKSFKENGYIIKSDTDKNTKILIRLKGAD